jgi:hypothetical protein
MVTSASSRRLAALGEPPSGLPPPRSPAEDAVAAMIKTMPMATGRRSDRARRAPPSEVAIAPPKQSGERAPRGREAAASARRLRDGGCSTRRDG